MTLNNLKELIGEGLIRERDLTITEVPDPAFAEKISFEGSPSILVDGIDIYTGAKPKQSNYSCRIYEFDGKRTGIVPKEFIREKIIALRTGTSESK